LIYLLKGKVSTLLITHKDRLLRFGSELLFIICGFFGVEVRIIDAPEIKSDEEQLVYDVLEILTVFSSRIYGKRSHRNKKAKSPCVEHQGHI
jgi:putative resolvase